MRIRNGIPVILILLCLALPAYCFRRYYLKPFDAAYWTSKYEQSQWKLPLSTRTIGDDGLYLYEGFRLITGGDPSSVNAEMPPFGKYLIGVAVTVFGNGNVYGYLSTAFLVLTMYGLAVAAIPDNRLATTISILLATDPLVMSQFPLTMLDSLHAGIMLMIAAITYRISDHRRYRPPWIWYILTGLFLGVFGATKSPMFLPLAGLFVVTALIHQQHSPVIPLIAVGSSAIVTYLTIYLPYFRLGHTILEWLKLQKWMVMFYVNSPTEPTYGSMLSTMLANTFVHPATRTVMRAAEWSALWPIIFVVAVITFGRVWRIHDRQPFWRAVLVFLLSTVALFNVIPFWSRYLLTILPFLYLIFGRAMAGVSQHARRFLLTTLILVQAIGTIGVIRPSPERAFHQFLTDWQQGFFDDMYEQLIDTEKHRMDRTAYTVFGRRTLADGEIESIAINAPPIPRHILPDNLTVPVTVTYYTRHLGSFSETHTIRLQRENTDWKFLWNWDDFISDLTTNDHLVTTVDFSKRGTIMGSDKVPISFDFPSYMVWITPSRISVHTEYATLDMLSQVFRGKIPRLAIHHRYAFNRDPDQPVPLGVLPGPIHSEEINALSTISGITLTSQPGRTEGTSTIRSVGTVSNALYHECCSYLYSTSTYDGYIDVEKERNHLLKGENGGRLSIINANGVVKRVLIQRERRNGEDSIL